MSTTTLNADYLVIGAGATAMAFVDTLLDQSDSSVIMVGRHTQPYAQSKPTAYPLNGALSQQIPTSFTSIVGRVSCQSAAMEAPPRPGQLACAVSFAPIANSDEKPAGRGP